MVVAEKPHTSQLRVCLDLRDLNMAIEQPHYPLPTFENITSKLVGAKYLGIFAIKLTEESSRLTTFNTVFGHYHFGYLPFKLISAQDEFQ